MVPLEMRALNFLACISRRVNGSPPSTSLPSLVSSLIPRHLEFPIRLLNKHLSLHPPQNPPINQDILTYAVSALDTMGCCGNEDEEEAFDIFTHLIPNNPSTGTLNSSAPTTVISPMNSNFSALICRDILRSIFERLSPADLARSACVCRIWWTIASDREIQTRAFKAPWNLKEVVGNPSSGSFWRDNSLGRFAISHRLIRGDSVASLAVKYSVQVMDIKRLNNMMSDHGVYSRERLLIPVSKPELLHNGTCYIEVDAYAKREVAVLYLEGAPDGKSCSSSSRVTTDIGKRRVLDSLKRSMQVDDGTAEYYWSISNGDPRAAFSEFSKDLSWEQQAGLS